MDLQEWLRAEEAEIPRKVTFVATVRNIYDRGHAHEDVIPRRVTVESFPTVVRLSIGEGRGDKRDVSLKPREARKLAAVLLCLAEGSDELRAKLVAKRPQLAEILAKE